MKLFACAYCEREYQLPFLARHCELDHEKEARETDDQETVDGV